MGEAEKEKLAEEEQQLEEAFIIKPLDGGYGWVVVVASFLANVIVDGVIFTVGAILLPLWTESFQANDTQVAFTMSLLSGGYLLAGPIASAFCNMFGCRTVVIIGSCMSFFGFVVSTIAPNVYVLYLTFGVVGGVGFGLIYLPAIVVISSWFSEKRSLATGLAVCGSGIGTTLFATINPYVNEFLGKNWRLFLVYCAILSLLPILSALAYKQVKPSKKQLDEATKIAEKEVVSRKTSAGAQLGGGVEPRPRLDSQSICKSAVEQHAQKSSIRAHGQTEHEIAEEVARETIEDLNRPLAKADAFYTGSTSNLAHRERTRTTSGGEPRTRTNSTVSHHSRADSTSEKHQSNVYLSQVGLPQEDESPLAERSWKTDLQSTLKALLDPTLLGSPSFITLALSGFLTMICFYVPFNYMNTMISRIPDVTEGQKSIPIALIGIINIVARISCGWIADRPAVDALMVSNIFITLAGIATACIPLFTNFPMYIAFCFPFAFGLACFAALRSIICVELFGLDKLSNAFGILLTFMGVGAVVGVPIAAAVKEATGSFDMSFYIMGSIMAVSGAMCFPLRRLRAWEERKALLQSASPADAVNEVELEKLNA